MIRVLHKNKKSCIYLISSNDIKTKFFTSQYPREDLLNFSKQFLLS